MKKILTMIAMIALLTGLSGCSDVFYPRADGYAEQAKGSNSVETVLNLITMMETSAEVQR